MAVSADLACEVGLVRLVALRDLAYEQRQFSLRHNVDRADEAVQAAGQQARHCFVPRLGVPWRLWADSAFGKGNLPNISRKEAQRRFQCACLSTPERPVGNGYRQF